jgi:hypothetical protein
MNSGEMMKRLLICILFITNVLVLSSHSATKTVTAENGNHSATILPKSPPVILLTKRFMNQLVQEVDHEYHVINFHTKAALIESFSAIASTTIAKKFVDTFYYEKEDKLYIIPTETPPWFMEENIYQTEIKNQKHYVIKQANTTDLYGDYTIIIDFMYENGRWRIENVRYD